MPKLTKMPQTVTYLPPAENALAIGYLEATLNLERGIIGEREFAEVCLAIAGRENRKCEVTRR